MIFPHKPPICGYPHVWKAQMSSYIHGIPLTGRSWSTGPRQQIFTCQVFTEQGALLWRLEDVIFRKARHGRWEIWGFP